MRGSIWLRGFPGGVLGLDRTRRRHAGRETDDDEAAGESRFWVVGSQNPRGRLRGGGGFGLGGVRSGGVVGRVIGRVFGRVVGGVFGRVIGRIFRPNWLWQKLCLRPRPLTRGGSVLGVVSTLKESTARATAVRNSKIISPGHGNRVGRGAIEPRSVGRNFGVRFFRRFAHLDFPRTQIGCIRNSFFGKRLRTKGEKKERQFDAPAATHGGFRRKSPGRTHELSNRKILRQLLKLV